MDKIDELVRIYFSPDNVADYITVIYEDGSYLSMDDRPMHPQGFGQHGEGLFFNGDNSHLGERKCFADLNEQCQACVMRDLY